jgi:hypothetical protein
LRSASADSPQAVLAPIQGGRFPGLKRHKRQLVGFRYAHILAFAANGRNENENEDDRRTIAGDEKRTPMRTRFSLPRTSRIVYVLRSYSYSFLPLAAEAAFVRGPQSDKLALMELKPWLNPLDPFGVKFRLT